MDICLMCVVLSYLVFIFFVCTMIVLTLSKLFDEIYSKGKILGVMVKTCLFFLYWDIYRAFRADHFSSISFSSLSILSFPKVTSTVNAQV